MHKLLTDNYVYAILARGINFDYLDLDYALRNDMLACSSYDDDKRYLVEFTGKPGRYPLDNSYSYLILNVNEIRSEWVVTFSQRTADYISSKYAQYLKFRTFKSNIYYRKLLGFSSAPLNESKKDTDNRHAHYTNLLKNRAIAYGVDA